MQTVVLTNDRPAYKILGEKGFFGPDDHLYVFGEMIYFDDEPNMDMEPLNPMARERMKDYLSKLDDLGRAAAKHFGRPYQGLATNLDEAVAQSSEDYRRVQSVGNPNGVAVMKSDKRSKNNGIQRVAADETPETGANRPVGKLSIKKPVG